MLKNLKIGVRLMALVTLLTVCMVALGYLGLRGMVASDDALDTIYVDRVVPLRDLKVIADMYAVNVVDTAQKTLTGIMTTVDAVQNIDEARATIAEKWKAYLATYLVDEERKIVDQIIPLMQNADKDIIRLRAIIEENKLDLLSDFSKNTLYQAIDPVSAKFSSLVELQLRVAKDTYDRAEVSFELTKEYIIILILGAFLISLILSVAIIRSITRPLASIVSVIGRMAEGDLSVSIIDDGRRDEVGDMVRAAARIVQTIKDVAGDLRLLIDAAKLGTLTTRADDGRHRGEFAVLIRGVNDLVEMLTAPLFEVAKVMAKLASGDVRGRMTGAYEGDLRALKGNVNRSLDALVSLLDEVSSFAGALAKGDLTETIEGSYQGDFAAIKANLNKAADQFRELVGSVTDTTQLVASASSQTLAASKDVSLQTNNQKNLLMEVSSAIEQTAAAIGDIARNAERSSVLAQGTAGIAVDGQGKLNRLTDTVERISTGNARIGQISSLIADIADKTYVLAINAGLEAIRAGEQGRGFGLIAHQITRLAEEVAQATRDIRVLIDEATDNVKTGEAAALAAGSAIGQIVESARESGSTVQAIAAAIDEQNAMAQVLKDRVLNLQGVGQNTAGAAEEISATMNALTDMAVKLKNDVGRIRISRG